jgi:hypothetical protein
MELSVLKKKRPPGRPPTGKVLVGFKLSPELAKTIRKVARQTRRQHSEMVEAHKANTKVPNNRIAKLFITSAD